MANEKPKPAMGARTKVLVMLFPTLSHAMALGRITHPNMPENTIIPTGACSFLPG